ncbi:MAG TPA: M28 family peptidase [Acidimicrobiales bacterium]|nr:M28 family peptidase [Acidimicrobiales bacterium]
MARRATRRAFLAGAAVTGTALAAGLGCSSDDGGDGGDAGAADGDGANEGDGAGAELDGDGVIASGDFPEEAAIFGWIAEVVDQGIRRPGYEADDWAVEWSAERFREIGLDDVHLEPIDVLRWEPTGWSLEVVAADGTTTEIDCFPVPYAAPVDGLEVELAAWDSANPAGVAGKASLYDVTLLRLAGNFMADKGSGLPPGTTPQSRSYDPDGTLAEPHVIPFGADIVEVMEPSMAAGAAAFIGVLTDYPGDSYEYYVPYDAHERDLPGVWIRGSDGARLRDALAGGPVQVRLSVATDVRTVESANVVGELPGADDEIVLIASHHDGPWASAVEDGSGISLVLAQATYWAARPESERPHRLRFLLQGGHMSGGAGLGAYVADHADELRSIVLELHLEHAALDVAAPDGGVGSSPDDLEPTGLATPRWWFTSRNPDLEATVLDALATEQLDRSMVVAPDAFGEMPPTDGALYHREGVPVVNFLAAPFYLFDAMDTIDKIDREHLVPISRAAARIVASTGGVSAADMRAGIVTA